MKKSIYQQREDAIPFNTTARLIIIPLVLIVFVVLLPEIMSELVGLVLATPEGQLISLPMTIGMMLAVFAIVFLMTKISKRLGVMLVFALITFAFASCSELNIGEQNSSENNLKNIADGTTVGGEENTVMEVNNILYNEDDFTAVDELNPIEYF